MRRLLLVTTLLLPACGETEQEVPPEIAEARAFAARRACVAEELLGTARSDFETVQSTVAAAGPAGEGVLAFSRAAVQHAELRHAVFALSDSSLNHAATSADSLRYAQTAAGIRIVPPEPETVEANVFADYERRAATLLADPDHPCNWRHELEAE